MMVSILQPNYFPWPAYFSLISISDAFVIYDDVQYTKQDWRNRCLVRCDRNPKWLTIPIERKQALSTKITDTRISNKSDWRADHISKLKSYYQNAAHQDVGLSFYEKTTQAAGGRLLGETLTSMLRETCQLLRIDTPLYMSSEMNLSGTKTERLIQICNLLNANSYVSGPAASEYLDLESFSQNSIDVRWLDYHEFTEMSADINFSRTGFSILDWIMFHGEKTVELITEIKIL